MLSFPVSVLCINEMWGQVVKGIPSEGSQILIFSQASKRKFMEKTMLISVDDSGYVIVLSYFLCPFIFHSYLR